MPLCAMYVIRQNCPSRGFRVCPLGHVRRHVAASWLRWLLEGLHPVPASWEEPLRSRWRGTPLPLPPPKYNVNYVSVAFNFWTSGQRVLLPAIRMVMADPEQTSGRWQTQQGSQRYSSVLEKAAVSVTQRAARTIYSACEESLVTCRLLYICSVIAKTDLKFIMCFSMGFSWGRGHFLKIIWTRGHVDVEWIKLQNSDLNISYDSEAFSEVKPNGF